MWRRGLSTILSRTLHDRDAGVTPFLRRAGRSAMTQGRLPRRWNLDLVPWVRDLRVLRIDSVRVYG
jgi:hypothetical protein